VAKRRSVPKDKKTKIPKKYLSGLSRSAKDKRASLLKRMSKLYKAGVVIPRSMFKARVK
tara:strand:- start:125 stop:301 length:177 start_codon:yes stop_codon:yes gene_type:complete